MYSNRSIWQNLPPTTKSSSFFEPSANHIQRTTFFSASPLLQRQEALDPIQDMCIGITPGPDAGPQRTGFTPQQQRRVVMAKFEAFRRISRALLGLSAQDPYILRIARGIFGLHSPDPSQLMNTIARIRDRLSLASITKGTCYDESCYTAGIKAHAIPATNEIVLCNRLFSLSTQELIRTLVHEAAHNAGIDAARVANLGDESYCSEGSAMHWRNRCNNLPDPVDNVDAWAWFIEYAAFGYQ